MEKAKQDVPRLGLYLWKLSPPNGRVPRNFISENGDLAERDFLCIYALHSLLRKRQMDRGLAEFTGVRSILHLGETMLNNSPQIHLLLTRYRLRTPLNATSDAALGEGIWGKVGHELKMGSGVLWMSLSTSNPDPRS